MENDKKASKVGQLSSIFKDPLTPKLSNMGKKIGRRCKHYSSLASEPVKVHLNLTVQFCSPIELVKVTLVLKFMVGILHVFVSNLKSVAISEENLISK